MVRRLLHSVHSLTFLGLGVGGIGGVIHLAADGAGEYILLAGFFNADFYILGLYILLPHYLAGEGAVLGGHLQPNVRAAGVLKLKVRGVPLDGSVPAQGYIANPVSYTHLTLPTTSRV